MASSTCRPWKATLSTFLNWVTSFWLRANFLSNLHMVTVMIIELQTKVHTKVRIITEEAHTCCY